MQVASCEESSTWVWDMTGAVTETASGHALFADDDGWVWAKALEGVSMRSTKWRSFGNGQIALDCGEVLYVNPKGEADVRRSGVKK